VIDRAFGDSGSTKKLFD